MIKIIEHCPDCGNGLTFEVNEETEVTTLVERACDCDLSIGEVEDLALSAAERAFEVDDPEWFGYEPGDLFFDPDGPEEIEEDSNDDL